MRQPAGEGGELGQRRARPSGDCLQHFAQLASRATGWGGAAIRIGCVSITGLAGIVLDWRGGIDLRIRSRSHSLAKIGCLRGRRLNGRTDRGKASGCQAEADCFASLVGPPGVGRLRSHVNGGRIPGHFGGVKAGHSFAA